MEIEMPIVSTKNAHEEDYWLSHDFWKNENVMGTPYETSKSDFFSTQNVSVAGHSTFLTHTSDSTNVENIFGELANYVYYKFSGYNYQIQIETLQWTKTYKVFATIVFDENERGDALNLYHTTNLKTNSAFDNFCSTAKRISKNQFDVTTEYGKQILTVLTCSKYNLSNRILIVAIEQ